MTATMHPGTGGRGGVRRAAVAGSFYPAAADELIRVIDADLARAGAADAETAANFTEGLGHELAGIDDGDDAVGVAAERPKAIIVPHAGYVYSGPIAASAYARLLPWRDTITRVVLLGPAHRVAVRSMAVSSLDEWDTPLGRVPVDAAARDLVAGLPGVVVDDRPHAPEHSLEVEVPFLQRVLGDGFTLLPIVVGEADPAEVADVLDAVWGGDETLIVISSDLSHYHDYATARLRDAITAENILAGDVDEIGPHDACGAFPVRGMLTAARRHGLAVELVDLRNSGDTAGPEDRVVGYGSFVLTAPVEAEADDEPAVDAGRRTADDFTAAGRQVLLDTAVEAIRARLARRPAEPVDPARRPPRLTAPGAAFVTLRDGERLLGCIGTLTPRRPLIEDVADNAVGAAFNDPRLPALTPDEFTRMRVHISVLSTPELLAVSSLVELRAAIRPGEDGLIIEAGSRRATFLPAVWEQLNDPDEFLDHLWAKAGIRPGSWPRGMRAKRYGAVEFGDDGPRGPVV